jgi:hypothetical protein
VRLLCAAPVHPTLDSRPTASDPNYTLEYDEPLLVGVETPGNGPSSAELTAR